MAKRFIDPQAAVRFIRENTDKDPVRPPKMIEMRERVDQRTKTLEYYFGVYGQPWMQSWRSAEEVVGVPSKIITDMRLELDGIASDMVEGTARYRWEDLPGKADLCADDIMREAVMSTESVMRASGAEVFALYLDASSHPGIFMRFIEQMLSEVRPVAAKAVVGDATLERIVNDPCGYFARSEAEDPIEDVITALRMHIASPTRDVSHAIGALLAYGQRKYASCVQFAEISIMATRDANYLSAISGRGPASPAQLKAVEDAERMKAQIIVDLLKE